MIREAACHCGKLTLRCAGAPAKISLCHCFDCQRRTGSIFSIAAFFPRAAVTMLTGEAHVFRRPSASGFDVSFHFCPHCGSSLWWVADRLPELVGIAVGAFADANFPMPQQAVWAEERHHWLHLPEDMTAHARNPVHSGPAKS